MTGIGLLLAAIVVVPVTVESLLDEMVEAQPRIGVPFTGRLWSSYDRRSVRNDGLAEGWYANNDRSQWLRTETVQGRTEGVMVDAKGPGAVTRIWTANGAGTILRFYLDGASDPTWTGLATNLTFGLAKPIPFPLQNAISPKVEPQYRAYNLYLPILYAKSIRITAELPKKDHRFWYNVETRTYAEQTPVETLTPAALARAEATIARTADALRQKPSRADTLQYFRQTLAPGGAATLTIERADAAVRSIDLGLDRETMMSLRLKMSFDGEETVDVRAAQLLGNEAFAHMPMPFAKACEISVENLGMSTVDLSHARVSIAPEKWSPSKGLHFGAYGFALTNIPTRVGAAGYYDLPWLKLKGEGFLVGHALLLENKADYTKGAWWGEGDEKIYVDGETFPSYFGTGTEDFFGYAWGPNKAYDAAPFLVMPRSDGEPDAQCRHRAEMWRLRKLDTVPFRSSVRLDVEIWHWQDTTMDYAPATFWYARPGVEISR